MGGTSAEREVSLLSGMAVLLALQERGVDAHAIDVGDDLIGPLQSGNFDRVFNVLHGRGGEDGVIQGVLETLELPYTGTGVLGSALAMDKARSKRCWPGMGLPTPSWNILKRLDDIDACIGALGFPVMVKPALEGSSIGISRAENRQELQQAWRLAVQYQCDVYAEGWMQGKEYTIAILDGEALPVIRLETPHEFYDYAAKYDAETTRYHCPSGLPEEQEKSLQELALDACRGLAVEGWARVDCFIDDQGRMQLIEVNTVPGMTDHSLVPMAARAAGMEFEELVWRILETSVV